MKRITSVSIFAIVTSYMMQSVLNIVHPTLASISASFPDIPYTSIVLIATIPTLLSIPTNLISGKVALKIGYKTTLLASTLLVILSGIVPAITPDNFTIILISRVFFGIGYGFGFPLSAMMVLAYFDKGQHSKMMGYGAIFCNVGAIVFSALSGVLATAFWAYSFYLHIIMAVPFVFGLFLQAPPKAETPVTVNANAPVEKEKMNAAAWLYVMGLGLVMLFIFPFFTYASAIVVEKGIGGPAEAGYVITTVAIVGMIVGFIFPKTYGLLRRKVYSIGSVFIVIGMFLLVFGSNLFMMILSAVFVSFGFYHIMTAVFVGIGEDVPGKAAATATGFTAASMNTFSFLASYVLTFLCGIFGMSGSMTAPFIFAIGFFIIVGIATLFIKNKQ